MSKGRNVLFGVIVALLVVQGALQGGVLWPQWKAKYSPKSSMVGESAPGLSPEQFLVALSGFREMVAGILWVRADAFFDQGNYDAVLPLIRLVTILDPNQIDVYATGMWHIGYNFTDEEQRSDRRYLPSAIALGEEGARNNPTTYELYFETGWMWFHKVDDIYPKAVGWFAQATQHSDMPPARKNILAKAYERNGQVDKAIDEYYGLFADAQNTLKKDPSYMNHTNADVIENNMDNLLVRSVQRGYQGEKSGTYANGDYDTKPPFDVGFSVKATVVDPNIIMLDGTWNVLPLGTRIRCILRDKEFPNAISGGVIWDNWKGVKLDPDKNLTYMQDQLFVRNQRFSKKIDMSKDPTMYPFKSKEYLLEFYYTPRNAPAHIQDKFGWNGEGMTDKNFLVTDIGGAGREGTRVVYTTLTLTRDMIKKKGVWADRVPVLKTANYKELSAAGSTQDIIQIPALRGQ